MSADITIKVKAEVQVGYGRVEHVGRVVTASSTEPAEDIRNAVTLAMRQVNEEIREKLR